MGCPNAHLIDYSWAEVRRARWGSEQVNLSRCVLEDLMASSAPSASQFLRAWVHLKGALADQLWVVTV